MTNLSQTFVSKRIAKQIKLIRYNHELQLYQLAVKWDDEQAISIRYLPEIHMYPYAIKAHKNNEVIKVREQEDYFEEVEQNQSFFDPKSVVIEKPDLQQLTTHISEVDIKIPRIIKQLDYDDLRASTSYKQALKQEVEEMTRFRTEKASNKKKKK